MAKNASITWTLTVNSLNAEGDTSNGLKDESFRYQIYREDELVKEGNFSETYLTDNTEDCEVNTGVKHIILVLYTV